MSEVAVPVNPWRLNDWFKDLSADQQAAFKKYNDELTKANKSMELVSPKTLPFADAIHFADSILASQMILKSANATTVYDLGSGNGFPGIVMAILAPKIQMILVEKDERKCEFLQHVVSTLGLKNVQIKKAAIESLPEGSVEVAIVRGLSSIGKLLILARKSFKKGGRLYHLKSEEWAVEVSEIPTQICSHWSPSLLGEYKLPVGAVKFSVVRTDKTTD